MLEGDRQPAAVGGLKSVHDDQFQVRDKRRGSRRRRPPLDRRAAAAERAVCAGPFVDEPVGSGLGVGHDRGDVDLLIQIGEARRLVRPGSARRDALNHRRLVVDLLRRDVGERAGQAARSPVQGHRDLDVASRPLRRRGGEARRGDDDDVGRSRAAHGDGEAGSEIGARDRDRRASQRRPAVGGHAGDRRRGRRRLDGRSAATAATGGKGRNGGCQGQAERRSGRSLGHQHSILQGPVPVVSLERTCKVY